ncbi:MAG TPA: alpha/beta-hydrolase family protein [Actinoplanes sp.]|nr:alpha/beta-hydrolase family protein [Actinoplanes sp.]
MTAVADSPTIRARPTFRRTRIVRRPLGMAGSFFAVSFFCAALTPSLLPRSWFFQGMVSGLTAAIGYGLGATVGALTRLAVRRRYPRTARWYWYLFLIYAPVIGVVFLALGTKWQQELRDRLGMPRLATYDLIRIGAVSLLTFAVLVLIARALRLATRRLARLAGRWVPKPVAYAAAVVVVSYLVIGLVDGFLSNQLLAAADRTASLANGRTSAQARFPDTRLRSGGPESLTPWRTLGMQGREFIGTGPTRDELTAFGARPALEPIRLYAGLESAGSAEERARLVLREMDRTGAFDRAVVAVITPTGTGWVDANVTDALEYMYAGDTALVSMQYSYLPSWISFLVDRSKVAGSARALIGAVHQRWASLPPASRPKLLLFGESLGSYGTESAYPDAAGLTAGADGVLLVGPPFASPIRNRLLPTRDAGSPVWDPVFSGTGIEFSRDPADLRAAAPPRVVYLQNSSDPIVWFHPRLLVREPEWLRAPRGPDVSPDMQWHPGITFWQTAVDQFFANSAPPGHGHVYGSGVVDGWAALAAPPGWIDADTVRLRTVLDTN